MDENANAVTPPSATNAVAAQLGKMRDANLKYKNLLKLAKERIQQQEDELKRLRAEKEENKVQKEKEQQNAVSTMGLDDGDVVGESAEHSFIIVRVCHRIKVELDGNEVNSKGGRDEVWALIEFESYNPDQQEPMLAPPPRRTKKWKRFDAESDLSDFIRRDTGEPLSLPPPSLSVQQSQKIQESAKQSVSQITEEFRRYRVKAEMTRKQQDSQIRELQRSNAETAKRRIQGNDAGAQVEKSPRSENSQVERMRGEMAQQDAQWKEAYEVLLAENNVLKSSGSEALLASQWRQRYEVSLKEKEDMENKLKMERQKSESTDAGGKYELKYRDLKESFRLYRKKAKEIFEAQQSGEHGLLALSNPSTEDAKLSYLKNLMVNYLTSDIAVREHMEGAIGTVLQFTPDDIVRIEKKKTEGDYWGLF